MEHLVQRKLATAGPQEDKLAPFRQQAAVIRRNKEASATKVHELAATLKDHEATLADLQSQVGTSGNEMKMSKGCQKQVI